MGDKTGFEEGRYDGLREGDSDDIGDGSKLGTEDAVTYMDGMADGRIEGEEDGKADGEQLCFRKCQH